jgi:quinol-cytochrome oxidoreductase complex cytochrome b subunit
MGPFLRWFLRKAVLALAIFLGAFAVFLVVFAFLCAYSKSEAGPLPDDALVPKAAPNVRNRPLEDAYYSYPEWYIVWSYQERAAYLEKGSLPSGFPYFG